MNVNDGSMLRVPLAVRMNNEGVQLLVAGRYDVAFSKFRIGLEAARIAQVSSSTEAEAHPRTTNHAIDPAQRPHTGSNATTTNHGGVEDYPLVDQQRNTMTVTPVTIPFHQIIPSTKGMEISSFMYSSALLIENGWEPNIASVVIILNLGIMYHLKGISSKDMKFIHRAAQLYKNCLRLTRNLPHCNITTSAEIIVLNNSSLINYSNGEYGESRGGFLEASMLLEQTNRERLILQPNEIGGILLNIIFLRPPVTAQAA